MKTFIGFKEALELTLASVPICVTEILPLNQLTGRILAEDIVAQVDCPSISTSRKDGYAVFSKDLSAASPQNPIKLDLIGNLTAGDPSKLKIISGQMVRVTTGAPLPDGADAVLSEEFCQPSKNEFIASNTAAAGRNIQQKGRDIRKGEIVASKGDKLVPALIGFLAAAGRESATVYKSPKLAVIATGDEVLLPGEPISTGKLYASNLVEICSWLSIMDISYSTELVPDRKEEIENAIIKHLPEMDGFLISGGAWGSERDLILDVVESMNWQGIYHRVRMGPGKPVGFGLLDGKPFFLLPGGPPSNEMAFIQLAIPALLKMKSDQTLFFPLTSARLAATVYGKKDWTDFVHARLEVSNEELIVHPARLQSGLRSMACKEALIIIPEDREKITEGENIEIQLMTSSSSL